MFKENMFDEIFPGAKEKQIERAENLKKVALDKSSQDNVDSIKCHKSNVLDLMINKKSEKANLNHSLYSAIATYVSNGVISVEDIAKELTIIRDELIDAYAESIEFEDIPF